MLARTIPMSGSCEQINITPLFRGDAQHRARNPSAGITRCKMDLRVRDFVAPWNDVGMLQFLALPTGKTRDQWVNARGQKHSTLPKFGKGVCVASTRPKEEGRIAIVTYAGRAAVDAGHIGAEGFAGRATVSEAAAHTIGVTGVRQNRVVLAPAGWRQALR